MGGFVSSALLLLVGGLVGWSFKRLEVGRNAKIEAGDLLAEVPRIVWRDGEGESWQGLVIFLGRLRIRLRAAGVPADAVHAVVIMARTHWRGVEPYADDGPEEGRSISRAIADDLDAAVDCAQTWIFGSRHPMRRQKALAASRALTEKYGTDS